MTDTTGFAPIAVREERHGCCVISYNRDTKKFMLGIDGKVTGPFTERELKAFSDNIKDVLDMRGRYLFIKDFHVDGSKVDDLS